MAFALHSSGSNMARNIKSCSPKGRTCLAGTRHGRGYCWGAQHHKPYSTYPKSLISLDSYIRSFSASDTARLSYARTKKLPSRDLKTWRASSSWGRWTWDWDKSIRKLQTEINHHKNDAAAWERTFERFDKDTAELCELIKKRIDADPFDALFGRSLLYPNRARATWRGLGGSDRGPKSEQRAPGTSNKPAEAAGVEVGKKQHADQSSGFPPSTQRTSVSADQNGLAGDSPLAEEYDIDFISMRKIPKGSMGRAPGTSLPSVTSDQTFDIPLKLFKKVISEKPSLRLPDNEKTPRSSPATSQLSITGSGTSKDAKTVDWLSQEGFGSKKGTNPVANTTISEPVTKVSPTKIESALERRMRTKPLDASANGARSRVAYDPKENQTDDVDLLRASDIRAASGAAGRLRKHAEVQKHENRMKLEADFAALQEMKATGLEWKKELAAAKKRIQEAHARKRDKASDAHLEEEIRSQKAAMEALEMRRAGEATPSSIVTDAHPEPGEGDMASNVHEFAARDRWYKKKAPHAAMTEEQKSVQLDKSRSLVREIRGIYEDAYGAIDTKHRQPSKEASEPEEQKSSPSPKSDEGSVVGGPGEMKKATESNGPLSTKEKIDTMLQQLLDDSRYLQKLIRTPELTSRTREELFHRNRSMQNASDAIAEALVSTLTVPSQGSVEQATMIETRSAMNHGLGRSQPVSPSNDVKKPSTVYNVLAYDPSIQQVTTAEMSSSGDSSSERRLSLSEALSSLTDPVKFLPQLTRLQSQGFEIVSSDTNILVLKKNYKLQPSKAEEEARLDQRVRSRSINPIDGTTTQAAEVGSPRGCIGHNSGEPARTVEGKEAEPSPSGYKVRREEDVFSGSSGNRWDDRRTGDGAKVKSRYRRMSRRRRTTKRMLLVGLWTAGCCYAVGAITELLRA
ncbi:MAG: hypothetical protein L6R36_007832 [Xanthoria steineri]|nr:MAG: hypothetical protein L6R36_007832 [Xanthoria steineri]